MRQMDARIAEAEQVRGAELQSCRVEEAIRMSKWLAQDESGRERNGGGRKREARRGMKMQLSR